jgi:aconitate hydratase
METPLAACRRKTRLGGREVEIYSLTALTELGFGGIPRLPICLRIILESVVRHADGNYLGEGALVALANWQPNAERVAEIPFVVGRVVLQDVAGIPLLGDLAAMRDALNNAGYSSDAVRPAVPVDMVIDHTLSVEVHGTAEAASLNMSIEMERNTERFKFVKWASQAFGGIRVIPPGNGILHQINLEYLSPGLMIADDLAFPDTMVGTDSHSCMIAGLGVVGWGVGGIEAEAAMLGQPVGVLTPDVVAVQLTGELRPGVTATDLVLYLTRRLREADVVGKFVEFVGTGVRTLTVPDRATIANMAPEYGATIGFFPFDEMTARYLRETGRSDNMVASVEQYFELQGCRAPACASDILYSETIELDLSEILPCVAGPRRPQDTIYLSELGTRFKELVTTSSKLGGYGKAKLAGRHGNQPGDGDVVIASITSCTNTANPIAILTAGLVARKAVQRGLRPKPWVKTSFAPGSRVVSHYLERTGLQADLDALGFNVVGYGCATCIGNSGPIQPDLEKSIVERNIVACAVLSGNRNFESRIHPALKAAFLASPPNVVAYALAGTVCIDLNCEPLGIDSTGAPVKLSDLWPTADELAEIAHVAADSSGYHEAYAKLGHSNPIWNALPIEKGELFNWNEHSTLLKEPPFLKAEFRQSALAAVQCGRILALLGDSITTDHISPIGRIRPNSIAAAYLRAQGVRADELGSFGERRMNHLVMVRGTFDNPRLRNRIVPAIEGAVTRHFPSNEQMPLYTAAERYRSEEVPLFVIAGREFGVGSARDWAAKGIRLLGVKVVLAKSFERIHRSNLIGMGVLPCEFQAGVDADTLELEGNEELTLCDIDAVSRPRQAVSLLIRRQNGSVTKIQVILRADTPSELAYLKEGGIMPWLFSRLARQSAGA